MFFRSALRLIFASFYTAVVFVTLVLTGCLWWFGPMLAFGERRPFDGVTARVVTISIVWFLAILWMILVAWRRRRRDRKMADDIVATVDTDSGDDMVKAELGDLRDKLRTAMVQLRKSKLGRKHLYELPWYVMIGPPGAGKTTAIVNSGLNFPLAGEIGKTAIGGVGGTRNCDWWFTDGAVLIDTAGRYTTQESDATADNAGWLGFLALLKKHRKRQPINGAMVAISLSDLSPDLQKLLESMKQGDITQPLRGAKGYQLLKLETATTSETKPFEEAREDISNRVFTDKRTDEFEKYLQKLRTQAIIEWKNQDVKKAYDQGLAAPRQTAAAPPAN